MAGVFGVDGVLDHRRCRLAHHASCLIGERFEGALDLILSQFSQRRIERSDKVMLELGFEKTDRAEDPRRRRHEYSADFERASHLSRKERTIAAEGDQREVPRIPAALHRDGSHRTGDAGAADEISAVGRFLQRQTEGRGYLHGNRAPRFGRIESQSARQPILREITKRYIGVGQSRRGPAIAVANRARCGAGALCGPRCKAPALSTVRMLPPPAPTSAISIAGVRRRYPPPLLRRLPREIGPPTSNSLDRRISYSSITEALVVVPPISRLMTFATPSRRAIAAVPMTPAAGPDSIS